LLYNDKCPMCADLASKARDFSGGLLSTLPLSSHDAAKMLDVLYGEKTPKSYLLISKDRDKISVRCGYKAALGLAPLIGWRKSLRLFGTYLGYQGRQAAKVNGKSCCGQKAVVPPEGRRMFIRSVFFGGVALAISAIGFPSSSLFHLPPSDGQSSRSVTGGLQILDPSILKKLLEEAMSSADYNNVTPALTVRNLTVQPQVGQGFVRIAGELDPMYSCIIPFGVTGFYTGYVMYRRHGTDTYATSYVRHVHALDPPGFEYLSASSNGTRMPPPEHTPKDGCISGNNGLCTCCSVTTVCCCITGTDPTNGESYCVNETFYPCYANANGEPCGYICSYPQWCPQEPCSGCCTC
jgi:hypothetical protein